MDAAKVGTELVSRIVNVGVHGAGSMRGARRC